MGMAEGSKVYCNRAWLGGVKSAGDKQIIQEEHGQGQLGLLHMGMSEGGVHFNAHWHN